MLPTGLRHVPDGQDLLQLRSRAGELEGHGLLKSSPFHLRRGGAPDFRGDHTKKEKKKNPQPKNLKKQKRVTKTHTTRQFRKKQKPMAHGKQ